MIVWLIWIVFPPGGLTTNMIVVSCVNYSVAIFSIVVAVIELNNKDSNLLHSALLLMVIRNGMRTLDFEQFLERGYLKSEYFLNMTLTAMCSFQALFMCFTEMKVTWFRGSTMLAACAFHISMHIRRVVLMFPDENVGIQTYAKMIVLPVIFYPVITGPQLTNDYLTTAVSNAQRQSEFAFLLDKLKE